MTIAIPRLDRSTAAERGITLADFLVPVRVAERTPTRVRHVVLIVVGALVVALTAQIVIPTRPVPFTGQTLRRAGRRRRAGLPARRARPRCCTSRWALPVCRSSPRATSGASKILGATGGYLIGFVVAAAIVGRLAELGWDRHIGGSLAAMAIGTAVIYAIGVPGSRSAGHPVGDRGRARG